MRILAATFALLVVGLISLALRTLGSAAVSADADSATLLLDSRRRVEAQWLMRKHGGPALNLQASAAAADGIPSAASRSSAVATIATPSDEAQRHLAAPVATDEAHRRLHGCEGARRPYHTILTSSSGGYQVWQCRVMYHHWKMQKRADPCGEMGGFTRLLTSYGGKPYGGSFDDEIPTFYVKELAGGAAAGYVVVNRPYSMLQFVQHPEFRDLVREEYVYIAETDHILLRPLPNLATPDVPAAFNFSYMVAWGQAKIVEKFVPGLGGKTDPVGPSPVIIHVNQLERMVQPWFDFTNRICADREAVQALGWVREMWGWCIAAGSLGIKHRVLDAFQYEGGSIGNRERPLHWPVASTPVGPARVDMPYYVFHYTYGIEYSAEGLPMELQVGEWSLDKRHYMGGHPPLALLAPPKCAHDRAHVLTALINNASAALSATWNGRSGQLDGFHHLALRAQPSLRTHSAAARLLGTGPWTLSGKGGGVAAGQAYRLEKLWILNHGWLIAPKGHGRWGLARRADGTYEEEAVTLTICAVTLTVRPQFGADEWTLRAVDTDELVARLETTPTVLALWNAPLTTPTDALAARVEGSGPYKGRHNGPGEIVLLRAGVAHVNGGRFAPLTRWRPIADTARRPAIALGSADGGLEVIADFPDCWILRFAAAAPTREPDATGAPPPRYGAGIGEWQAEWIVQPAAQNCRDACAGLTLRRLTDADRAGSVVARSVEDCCTFSWAGVAGLRFGARGQLITPWGGGTWGAPPEAQGDERGALLAEFAGHKHLLYVQIETLPDGTRRAARQMRSTRCSDNDPSAIGTTEGTPRQVAAR